MGRILKSARALNNKLTAFISTTKRLLVIAVENFAVVFLQALSVGVVTHEQAISVEKRATRVALEKRRGSYGRHR